MMEIDTSRCNRPEGSYNIRINRYNMMETVQELDRSFVTIIVQGFNNIEKTKDCIGSILKYTTEFDYELILVDNGSDDGTLEYFESIQHPKKKIVHITKNIGSVFPTLAFSPCDYARYIVTVTNDVIVTKNWLENLFEVLFSDPSIGMVCPVSSNVSNLQQINLEFDNAEEMHIAAAKFNVSDPTKWQERLKLLNLVSLYRKEALLSMGLPIMDMGYSHDFADDDIGFRVRRAGYKAILACDTWVHHNHKMEERNLDALQKSIDIGKSNFKEKYQGIDAWDDVLNFWILDITPHIPKPLTVEKKRILGVDVKCGTPILDVKNHLRKFGIFEADLSAFTQMEKYVTDLKTICNGIVSCDREEFFARQFPKNYYDYIVVDQPLNRYHEPQQMLEDCFSLLKPGGMLMFPLLNTFSFREYLYCLGYSNLYNREFAYDIPAEAVQATVERFGNVVFTTARFAQIPQEDQNFILKLLPDHFEPNVKESVIQKLMIDRYFWGVQKK